MKSICIVGLAVAVGAAVVLLSVLNAAAQPVPGAFYAGGITGCAAPPCGTVDFTASGDGSQVEDFTAYDVPGDVCQFQGANPFPIPLDIVDDSFGPGIPDMYEVSGSFPSAGSAQGTLRLVLDEPACDSGTLNWTATSSGTPTPPPVGGLAEVADVPGSSTANYLALAALAAVALGALTAGAWYAGRRRAG